MIVVVASRNPIKVSAVEYVFKRYYKDVTVKAIDVDIDLPKQPIGLDEILSGAYRRSRYAIENVPNAEYGVGIEAGLSQYPYTESGFLNIQACIIYHKSGRYSLGISSGFELPRNIVEYLIKHRDCELEDIAEDITGVDRIGEKGGIISYLTRDFITRRDLTIQAVATAIIPFINKELYSSK